MVRQPTDGPRGFPARVEHRQSAAFHHNFCVSGPTRGVGVGLYGSEGKWREALHFSLVESSGTRRPASLRPPVPTGVGPGQLRVSNTGGSSPAKVSIRSTRSSGSIRSAVIGNEKGEVVFEQRDVEIPKFWSQQATNIVVSKYFRGQIGTPERERSVKQLIGRVVDTITAWAREQKYFASEDDLQAFSDDLKHLLVYQKAAFN